MATKVDEKNIKTLCPLAWNHSFVNNDGHVQLCCTSEEFDNTIRTNDGKKIHILDNISISEVMNTDYMKKIRQQMLKGDWPSMCLRCEMTEKQGGASRRTVELKSCGETMNQLVEITDVEGGISPTITSADYRLGNLCNLQCRMCSPKASRMWVDDWSKVGPDSLRARRALIEPTNFDWIDSENAIQDLQRKAATLEHLHFAGGEPLLTQQMSHMLEECVRSGNAHNITLTYNTNLTQLPPKVLELWKEFKAVKLFVSVDAVGGLNNYIRYPSKWELIDKNLRFIDTHHNEYNVTECLISTTVQAVNVCHLCDLVEYLTQFQFIVPMPNLINLYHPPYLATTVLPHPVKKMALIQLNELVKKQAQLLPQRYLYLLENVSSVTSFMLSRKGYEMGDFDVFKKFTRDYDNLKGLDLISACPEFSAFIKTEPIPEKSE